MAQTGIDGKAEQERRAVRNAALQQMAACLATILVVDGLVRALIEGIFTRNAAGWPYNPAVTRIAGSVTSRLIEVVAVLIALAILFRITRFGSFADLGLRRRGLKWLPVGFIIPIVSLVVAAIIVAITGLVPVNRLLYPGPWPTLYALAAATQAGFIEEIAFRGVLMQGIERSVGTGQRAKIIAIVVSGALFASLHLLAPFQLTWAWWIVVTLAGMGFGYAFYAAGRNLWLPIGLHWGFDLGLFLLLGLPGESRGWILSPVFGSFPSLSQMGGYIMLIGALLTTLVLVLLLHNGWKQQAALEETASGRTA